MQMDASTLNGMGAMAALSVPGLGTANYVAEGGQVRFENGKAVTNATLKLSTQSEREITAKLTPSRAHTPALANRGPRQGVGFRNGFSVSHGFQPPNKYQMLKQPNLGVQAPKQVAQPKGPRGPSMGRSPASLLRSVIAKSEIKMPASLPMTLEKAVGGLFTPNSPLMPQQPQRGSLRASHKKNWAGLLGPSV